MKTFKELKSELEAEIAWFDSEEVSIEDATKHYKKAKELIEQLQQILEESVLAIKKLK